MAAATFPSYDDEDSPLETVQYMGISGYSATCLAAIQKLVLFGDQIEHARLLTCGNFHAFLLAGELMGRVFIRAGFASGYPGEGPRTLAEAIGLLEELGLWVEEVEISKSVMTKLQRARLDPADINSIEEARPVHPHRISDYTWPYRARKEEIAPFRSQFPAVMPWALLDKRLIPIAHRFFEDGDRALLAAFRLLEDVVRERTGLTSSGTKLFKQAFLLDDSPLHWAKIDGGEQGGRASLFSDAFMAFRNPRAHRSPDESSKPADHLPEFLLANHLFLLEREAVKREAKHGAESPAGT